MRVFLTGATGFIGSAIVRELRTAGHDIIGLARSADAANALQREGIEAHRGDLADVESLLAGARGSDGVIHTAYVHDWSVSREETSAIDEQAVAAMTGVLEGTNKPFVLTSVTTIFTAPGHVTTEDDGPAKDSLPRAASENAAMRAAGRGVRASIVRLPPTVHGVGDHAFVPILIDTARRTGFSAFVEDGANRWPAVHRQDAARLFRLALENASAGTRLHGVAEEGVPLRAIAEGIGAGLGVPVRSISAGEAASHFGWFAHFAAIDNPTSSAATRTRVGWQPQEPELLADLRNREYFAEPIEK